MTPFDFTKSICDTKQDIMLLPEDEKAYNAFIINRHLSNFVDCIMQANEMNKAHHLHPRLQYEFLLQTIRKKKRWAKWPKKKSIENIELIKQFYKYSDSKARQVADLISDEEIAYLRTRMNKGGVQK